MKADMPPLNTLRFFEAATRLKSFKRAAEELNVTASAVSHSIQTLEAWFGSPLFIREPRALTPTPDALTYAERVRDVLDRLHDATARVPGRKAQGSLTLSIAPTFGSRWLMPRIRGFAERYPDIRIELDTVRQNIETDLAGVDLAIRRAVKPGSRQTWLRLVNEEIVPVCSPAFFQRASRNKSEILSAGPFITVRGITEDWSSWLKADYPRSSAGNGFVQVDTIRLAIEAAIAGLGIALGHKPLINDDLEKGDLMTLAHSRPAKACYWLVGSELVFERPEARLFRQWLLNELKVMKSGKAASHL
jgi:DNA-binding transcriptional LysR family regulator